jgi:hypothetical protein
VRFGSAWSETPACTDAPRTGTGRSPVCPAEQRAAGPHREGRMAVADDARTGEVRPRHSSNEDREQSRAAGCGADGAKGGGRGKCGSTAHGPGAGPGRRVTGAGTHTRSSEGQESGEVHRPAAPHRCGSAGASLSLAQAGCRTRRGRGDLDGVRRGSGGSACRSAHTCAAGIVPGTTIAAYIHPQA